MPRQQLVRFGLVLAALLWLAGCAGPLGLFGSANEAPPFRDPKLSMQNASDAIAIGKATQSDVIAALGPATVVKFDSGFEVWVYREKSAPDAAAAKAEFVILFAPTGIVKKTRIRPPYVGQEER